MKNLLFIILMCCALTLSCSRKNAQDAASEGQIEPTNTGLSSATDEQTEQTDSALSSTKSWLELVDTENYDQSWEDAAAYFNPDFALGIIIFDNLAEMAGLF